MENRGLNKEEYIAKLSAEENLAQVNSVSEKCIPKDGLYKKYIKRILDVMLALPAVIVFTPVYIVVGFMVWKDVGRPVIFRQKRTGLQGKTFNLIKFRSMRDERDENGELLPPEIRTTNFGRIIRKYSLDETLSFLLILKGDMSIIGPRPLPIEFEKRYSERHKMRVLVRPGLECPTLISDGGIRRYQEIFENDIWYVENISFITDCKMFAGLVKMVLNKKERTDHANVGGGPFLGYNDAGCAFSMRNIPQKYEEKWQEYTKGK